MLSWREKREGQPGYKQWKFFSPVWIRLWRAKWPLCWTLAYYYAILSLNDIPCGKTFVTSRCRTTIFAASNRGGSCCECGFIVVVIVQKTDMSAVGIFDRKRRVWLHDNEILKRKVTPNELGLDNGSKCKTQGSLFIRKTRSLIITHSLSLSSPPPRFSFADRVHEKPRGALAWFLGKERGQH